MLTQEIEVPQGTEKSVCEDIARRQLLGIKKYGTTVAGNPLTLKQWLQHAFEEALDMAIYLKRSIQELEKLESIKEQKLAKIRIKRNTDNERKKRNEYAKIFRQRPHVKEKLASYQRKRRNDNEMAAMADRLRARTREIFLEKRIPKGRTSDLIGCTYWELKQHIERKFYGSMGWHNRRKWHLDHVIPLSSANTIEELNALCHYSNLQPLWSKENQSKGSKLDKAIYLKRSIQEIESHELDKNSS